MRYFQTNAENTITQEKYKVAKPFLREVNKENLGICGGILGEMAFYLGGIKIDKLSGKFSYICTQGDEYSMYSSFVSREIRVVSLLGGRSTRK